MSMASLSGVFNTIQTWLFPELRDEVDEVKALRMSLSCKGFTLIELLVVIAIMSILMCLLLPVLKNAREVAQETICANNIKQIASGFHMYINERNDCFPPDWYNLGSSSNYNKAGTWADCIYTYIGGDSKYVEDDSTYAPIIPALICPSDPHMPKCNYPCTVKQSYGYNHRALGRSSGWNGNRYPIKIGMVTNPSAHLLASECKPDDANGHWVVWKSSVATTHRGFVNVVFVGGNVSKVLSVKLTNDPDPGNTVPWNYMLK